MTFQRQTASEEQPHPPILLGFSPHSLKELQASLRWSLAVAAVYAAAAIAGMSQAVDGSYITLLWAPSGIALAALLLLGFRVTAGVALGSFVANAWTGVPLGVATGIAVGNTLAVVLGVWLLTHYAGFRCSLSRRRDVFAIMALAAVVSTALSAVIGISTLAAYGLVTMDNWTSDWIKWWLGDVMGVLVIAPALLAWLGNRLPAISTGMALEALLVSASLIVVSYLIFGTTGMVGGSYFPAALAVLPFVIWGALRFGQRGASLLTLLASALAVWGTAHGTGPFAVSNPVDSLVYWCTFAIVIAVTGLLLAASVAEQRHAQAQLRLANADLEHQVSERTRDLQRINAALRREMTERRQIESEMIRTSEVQQRLMGRELHDGLGQYLTSLALLSAALRERLSEARSPDTDAAGRIVTLAHEAKTMMQTFARGLYPVALEFGGLPAALALLAKQTRELKVIQCVFETDPSTKVTDNLVAINLYRIAQEAVNNALKYSQASLIVIELGQVGKDFFLSISDDGIGLDPKRQTPQPGMGMQSMQYRARLLGGKMSVESQPRSGTRVMVTVSDATNTSHTNP